MKRLLLTMLVLVGFVAMNASAKEKTEKETEASETPVAKAYSADTNKDGKVSKEEYMALAKKNAEEKGVEFNPKRAANTFAKKDTNKDGFLSAEDSVQKKAAKKEKSADAAEK